ncbi:PepSY domain-containing protein [Alkalihalobacillus trypoxylicola]|uniref:PepSY domain-containing protein n=1 Tax=Alkalihalobacillus trypoxylicola TaxID=519424 RepID=A0A161Q681_9BACI|nr:PepSY domain-containing protein [Alkalihalobacillus trypoxylicola]KYG31808.1 hypothetical protein AZF04_03240 [Alkalihalobacillus trypoxylicola]
MKKWIIMIVTIMIILLLVLILFPFNHELSMEEIEEVVLKRYSGQIQSIELSGSDLYVVHLQVPRGEYEIQVNALNGEIISLQQVKTENEIGQGENEMQEWSEDEMISYLENETQEPVIRILESKINEQNRMIQIRAEQVDGIAYIEIDANSLEMVQFRKERKDLSFLTENEITDIVRTERDEDIEIEDIELEEDGDWYYYEIEFEDKERELEYIMIIDALTGEVISTEED